MADFFQQFEKQHVVKGEDSNSSLATEGLDELLLKHARPVAAVSTIGASTISGALTEHATLAELATLQSANRPIWGPYTAEHLGSLNGALRYNAAGLGSTERMVAEQMKMRGLGKGLAIGAGALVGSCAIDALMFGDTQRTAVSKMVDIMAMPIAAFLPVNGYTKAAAFLGIHTLARVYDKFSA